jgi:hypothetical protein
LDKPLEEIDEHLGINASLDGHEPNPAKPEPNFILMGTRPLAKSSP